MNAPSVAVVIPCYNAEAWLGRAIRSALGQPHCEPDVIVVDDGSTDGSVETARSFEGAIRLESGPNRGACAARNRGLAMTRCDHVLFLDADDCLEGDVLAAGARRATEEEADLVLSPMRVKRASGGEALRGPFAEPLSASLLFDEWLLGRQLNPSALLWRTDFLRKIGGWDEAVRINQDGELVMRALILGARLTQNPAGVGVYNMENPASVSRRVTREKLESYLYVYGKLIDLARGTQFESHMRSIRFELYRVSRRAFAQGETAIGRRALEMLHAIGFEGHYGNLRHRIAARLLGLETKVRLWGS